MVANKYGRDPSGCGYFSVNSSVWFSILSRPRVDFLWIIVPTQNRSGMVGGGELGQWGGCNYLCWAASLPVRHRCFAASRGPWLHIHVGFKKTTRLLWKRLRLEEGKEKKVKGAETSGRQAFVSPFYTLRRRCCCALRDFRITRSRPKSFIPFLCRACLHVCMISILV